MKNFVKINKFKIIACILSIILIFGLCSTVRATNTEYESLDFDCGIVTASCLNVRCGPGITYSRVGKIYSGEYVDVFAKVGNWYIIKTDDDLVGAVSSDYIDAVYEEVIEENVDETMSETSTEEVNETDESTETANETQTSAESSNVETTDEEIIAEEYADISTLSEEEQEFLDLINANREANGLATLEINSEIQNLARLKAQDLVENNYFSHDSETYGTIDEMANSFFISYTSIGENIAGNSSLSKAVEALMDSENHKANILSEEYNCTGVAIEESETYGKIFVEVFAKIE